MSNRFSAEEEQTMKNIIVFTVISLILAGGFYLNRQNEATQLQKELLRLQSEQEILQQGAAEALSLEKDYAAAADVAAFTEELYDCARQANIREHEVTTRRAGEQLQTGRRGKKNSELKVDRLQVVMTGSFRQIAEYIDRAQRLDAHKKIVEIDLLPGEKKLGASLTFDLYSVEAAHVR